MQNENTMKKVIKLLNTSSETFMLIALVSLFVLPVVLAKNLEPVLKTSYQKELNSIQQTQNIAETDTSDKGDVLGASTIVAFGPSVVLTETVKEDVQNLAFFDNHSSSLTESGYTLSVSTVKRFGKIPVLKLVNTGTTTNSYFLTIKLDGDLKVKSNQEKLVYVDNTEYSIDEVNNLPLSVLVSPGQEVIVSLMSNKTNPTNLSLSLTSN